MKQYVTIPLGLQLDKTSSKSTESMYDRNFDRTLMVMILDVPSLSPHGGNVWELLSITSRPNRKRWIELKQMSQVTGYAFWKRHNTHGKNQDLAAGFLLAKLPYTWTGNQSHLPGCFKS